MVYLKLFSKIAEVSPTHSLAQLEKPLPRRVWELSLSYNRPIYFALFLNFLIIQYSAYTVSDSP